MQSVNYHQLAQGLQTAKQDAFQASTQNLTEILVQDGFVGVFNHRLSTECMERMSGIARRVFDPHLEPYLMKEMHGAAFDYQCGYGPLHVETYEGKEPEHKHVFTRPCFSGVHPLYNKPYAFWWPLGDQMSQGQVRVVMRTMEEMALQFLEVLCCDLGIPMQEFLRHTKSHDSVFRLIDYPQVDGGDGKILRANAHCDSGYLTLTWATGPGLFLQKPNGDWEDGSVPEEHMVLTVGRAFQLRLAQLATKYPSVRARLGDRLITARKHKVVATPKDRERRFAFAYFFWPDPFQELVPGMTAAAHLFEELSRYHTQVAARDPRLP